MRSADGFYTAAEIRQRLSISTYVFWGYRPVGERALEELARHGITRIELLQSPEQFDMSNAGSMRVVGKACASCGIEIAAYHAHATSLSDIDTERDRMARVDLWRRQIDTMLDLGGVVWGSHVKAGDATAIKCYQELARHVEGTDVVIAVENFSPPGLHVADRMAFLDKIDHPQVGLILDIGHVIDRDGVNPMTLPGGPTEVLQMCRRRLRHIHLHGFKDGRDHFPPLVEGDGIQWVELFRMLRSIGYSGAMNFEPRHAANAIAATGDVPERIVGLESRGQ